MRHSHRQQQLSDGYRRILVRNKSASLFSDDKDYDDESEDQQHELQWSLDRSIRETRLSQKDLNQFPLLAWSGPVHVLNSEKEVESIVPHLMEEDHIGFDTETQPLYGGGATTTGRGTQQSRRKNPTSLLQFATLDCVYLYRICKTQTLDPIRPILESSTILKTGVGLQKDIRELKQSYGSFTPAGFVDITTITTTLGYENRGLNALSTLILGGRISKRQQCSDWGTESDLNWKQIRYASTDAWVSREVYRKAALQLEKEYGHEHKMSLSSYDSSRRKGLIKSCSRKSNTKKAKRNLRWIRLRT